MGQVEEEGYRERIHTHKKTHTHTHTQIHTHTHTHTHTGAFSLEVTSNVEIFLLEGISAFSASLHY